MPLCAESRRINKRYDSALLFSALVCVTQAMIDIVAKFFNDPIMNIAGTQVFLSIIMSDSEGENDSIKGKLGMIFNTQFHDNKRFLKKSYQVNFNYYIYLTQSRRNNNWCSSSQVRIEN